MTQTRNQRTDALLFVLRVTFMATTTVAGIALTAYGVLTFSSAPTDSTNSGAMLGIGLYLLLTVCCMGIVVANYYGGA